MKRHARPPPAIALSFLQDRVLVLVGGRAFFERAEAVF